MQKELQGNVGFLNKKCATWNPGYPYRMSRRKPTEIGLLRRTEGGLNRRDCRAVGSRTIVFRVPKKGSLVRSLVGERRSSRVNPFRLTGLEPLPPTRFRKNDPLFFIRKTKAREPAARSRRLRPPSIRRNTSLPTTRWESREGQKSKRFWDILFDFCFVSCAIFSAWWCRSIWLVCALSTRCNDGWESARNGNKNDNVCSESNRKRWRILNQLDTQQDKEPPASLFAHCSRTLCASQSHATATRAVSRDYS